MQRKIYSSSCLICRRIQWQVPPTLSLPCPLAKQSKAVNVYLLRQAGFVAAVQLMWACGITVSLAFKSHSFLVISISIQDYVIMLISESPLLETELVVYKDFLRMRLPSFLEIVNNRMVQNGVFFGQLRAFKKESLDSC